MNGVLACDPAVPLTCRALLFDLDGVLVLSGAAVERSWRCWARRHHLDPDSVLRCCHGRPSAETIAAVAGHLDAAAEADRLEREQAADAGDLKVGPGAQALLHGLPRRAWAVATSGTRHLAVSRLRAVGLPVPEVLVTADDVRQGKPDPESYLTAAARLGHPPSGCIVVEDARPGVLAARAAGARVIGIAGEALGPTDDVDLVVTTLAELTTLVDGDVVSVGTGAVDVP